MYLFLGVGKLYIMLNSTLYEASMLPQSIKITLEKRNLRIMSVLDHWILFCFQLYHKESSWILHCSFLNVSLFFDYRPSATNALRINHYAIVNYTIWYTRRLSEENLLVIVVLFFNILLYFSSSVSNLYKIALHEEIVFLHECFFVLDADCTQKYVS